MLLIFEGPIFEGIVSNSIEKTFFNGKEIIYTVFGNDLYEIYDLIKDEQDVDIVRVINENHNNLEQFNKVDLDDTGDIYLFFDYEAHDDKFSTKKVNEMLNFFDNETEQGKLFLSYPLCEALRAIPPLSYEYETITMDPKNGNKNKGLSAEICKNKRTYIAKYDIFDWSTIVVVNLSKSNKIVSNIYSIPENIISQIQIHQGQINTIKKEGVLYVLSSFPLFLQHYYGTKNLLGIIEEKKNKYPNYVVRNRIRKISRLIKKRISNNKNI